MTTHNLNDYVWFRWRDAGAEEKYIATMRAEWGEVRALCNPGADIGDGESLIARPSASGWVKMQIFEFITRLAPMIDQGRPSPVLKNAIRFDEPREVRDG